MGEPFGGATVNVCEPLDPFLMRSVQEVAVGKDICQAIWASVRLFRWLRRPKVTPPRNKGQNEENHERGGYKNCRQNISSRTRQVWERCSYDGSQHRRFEAADE
jgi:hypothetical protein